MDVFLLVIFIESLRPTGTLQLLTGDRNGGKPSTELRERHYERTRGSRKELRPAPRQFAGEKHNFGDKTMTKMENKHMKQSGKLPAF